MRLPAVSAAVELMCPRHESCEIKTGSFTTRLLIGQRGASVTVLDENVNFIFFDSTSSISIPLRRTPVSLPVYDSDAPDFVVNGSNNPVGLIEIGISDYQ